MKILCLGNNTEDTDSRTRALAATDGVACYGILSELDRPLDDNLIILDGYYHSSIYDIEYGRLLLLAQKFDQLVILDQTKAEYSHPDAFYHTVKLAKQLQPIMKVVFLNQTPDQSIEFFENLVQTNKSFCIYPFIELLVKDAGYTSVCCRSSTPVTRIDEIDNFGTDPKYQAIRQKMIDGTMLPEHCSTCYRYEAQGILSARQKETVEWANRLNLTSIEDLGKITHPAYYEVRPSNVCNLQCRMCNPGNSHLIGREYYRIGLIDHLVKKEYSNFEFIDFTNLQKLYVAGGEPTAMPEFYDFIDQCIATKNTNFEFLVNTNGTKINRRLREQLKHFPNMQFIISIDGFDNINHYTRWPSDWATIIDNAHYLQDHGHKISFNTAVSIYTISSLNKLLEFFDREFPGVHVHTLPVGSNNDILSAYNFPYPDLALASLMRSKQTRCYQNEPLLQSFVESLINNYVDFKLDTDKLRAFFEFNDRLDQSRDIQLGDYIPELEQARQLL